jgi:hypothetical protein
MNRKFRFWLMGLLCLVLVGFGPVSMTAAANSSSKSILFPNQQPKEDYEEKLNQVTHQLVEDASPLFNNAINILFTIIFLWGIWNMVYSMMNKQGRIMKSSTAILISTPLILIFIRVMFIFILSSNVADTISIGEGMITLLTKMGYLASIVLLTLPLFNFFVFRLIRHPEFQRRGKTFLGISIILIVLTAVIPGVLSGI